MNKANELEQRLLLRKIQPTSMRLLVLDCLVQQEAAVSLSDLEKLLSRSDRITLYRTMKTFEEKGLVHQIHDNSGIAKFALCATDCSCSYPDDVHIHFYCSPCDTTYCMPQLSVPHFDLPENFRADSGNFVISGHCPSCSA
ncbi:MAG: transcriptional repressor [Balneolales bacterium]